MNIEAKPGSELATRSSYENFVIELAEKMGVDEKVYLPKEEGEFDYEDIYSWIRAVDFRNGTPKIERTIKEDGGTKTVKLNTQELDVIKDEDEKLSKEAQLYVMAVTEAKMAVIAQVAEDTYPAVRYQMNDVRREMQKVRQEIFGVEDKKKSIKEVLDKMVSSKKIQAATALIIASMILAACTNPTQVSATEVINPTQPVATEVSPTPTMTPTAELTPTPSASPTIEPSPTPEFPTYEECGTVTSKYPADKDIYGHDRPTFFKETRIFGPTTEAIVVGCLADAQGKETDPNDIVNGYENTVIFYDKYGKPHSYRLIVCGERINTLVGREEIYGADGYNGNGVNYDFPGFQDMIDSAFKKNGSNETGMYLYISGGENASEFYNKISKNSEIYKQVVEAIKTGEGFPEDLPEDFFLYASYLAGPSMFR